MPAILSSIINYAAFLAFCACAQAATLTVTNPNATGGGSLSQAVTDAAPSDTIIFAAGLSGQSIQLGDTLVLDKHLTIDASALAAGIKILGNGRVLEVTAGRTVVLRSLEVRNGFDQNQGAGIYNAGTLTLEGCTLANNGSNAEGSYRPGEGGAIYNAGTLTLNQCTLAGNVANTGAAIYNGGTLTLNQSTISGNEGNNGTGGIRNLGALTLNNTVLAGNTTSSNIQDPNLSGGGNLTPLGHNLTSGDPQLAPLGDYGGPTQTMPPLVGSPAIDAGDDAAAISFATDQRGLPRLSSLQVDIGAAEWQQPVLTVTTLADSGPGSLRNTVPGAPTGALINFDPGLSGQTITLTSGEVLLNSPLRIDASGLQGGVTIAGNGSSHLFTIGASGNVTLVGLTFTGGNSGGGGAIYSAGGSSLRISRCTFSGNHANEGGAILNDGTLLVENSTFSGNTGGFGGALQCRNLTTLTHCTFSHNSANYGGAVFNKFTTLTVNNSILAGNTAGGDGGDLLSQLAALAFTGANLVQSIAEDRPTATTIGPVPLTHAPLLNPLGNYGGPTQTMPPLAGSPAIDAGGATALTTDQRGGARLFGPAPDLGAVEFAPFTQIPVAKLPGVKESSVAWADYNNDGRLDFLLTGRTTEETLVSQLWQNTGSGFTDVTASSFPAAPNSLPGVAWGSVAWGDYDNDSRLDFLLTGIASDSTYVSQLWRNTGSGFTNETASVAPGLPGVGWSSVAWGDYDNDGRLDFLLTGFNGSIGFISQLWRNTGSSFIDVTASSFPAANNRPPGVDRSSVAWGDYDNDGRLDFLLTGLDYSNPVSQLWRNTGSGFTNETANLAPGLPGVGQSSVAWGDHDNDGRLDFLLTGRIGSTNVAQLWRNNTGAPPNNYANWIAGFNVGSLTGVNDDFDHDGIGNAAENVLGTHPTQPNTALTLVSSSGGAFKFRHSQASIIAPDLTKTYQWSTDLTEWKTSGQFNAGGTRVTITEAFVTNNAEPENDAIEVTATITAGPANRLFLRLAATQAP